MPHRAVFVYDFCPSKWYLGKKYCSAPESQKSWYEDTMVTKESTEYKIPTSPTLSDVETMIRVTYPIGAESAVKKYIQNPLVTSLLARV